MLKQTLSVIHRLEDAALVFVFTSALMLALAQILLRNIFDIGFLWLESLLKIQVMWLALQGAMIGTRQGRHIRIDLLTRILPEQAAALAGRLVALFSAVICAMCASASRELVLFERHRTDLEELHQLLTKGVPFRYPHLQVREIVRA